MNRKLYALYAIILSFGIIGSTILTTGCNNGDKGDTISSTPAVREDNGVVETTPPQIPNSEEKESDSLQQKETNEVATTDEQNDEATPNIAKSEETASEVSTNEPISAELAEIVKAVEEQGYWFNTNATKLEGYWTYDGTKPKIIESDDSRLAVILDSEDGIFGRFSNRFRINEEKTYPDVFVWINTNNKPLARGASILEELANSPWNEVLYPIDACSLYKKVAYEQYELKNGITFWNINTYCSDPTKECFYSKYPIIVYFHDWKKKKKQTKQTGQTNCFGMLNLVSLEE
ncbi:MAG: hypothetical protein ACOX3T_08195 [Bdellovibrionota bacterium]